MRSLCSKAECPFHSNKHRRFQALHRQDVLSVKKERCALGIGHKKCLAGRVAWWFRMAGVGNRGNVRVALDRTLTFRVAGVGNPGGCVCQEDGGRALRVAGVGLRMHGGCSGCAGRWIRVASVGSGGTLRSVRFALQAWGMVRRGTSVGSVLRGRHGEMSRQVR